LQPHLVFIDDNRFSNASKIVVEWAKTLSSRWYDMASLWQSSERTTAKSRDRMLPSCSFGCVETLFVMVSRIQNGKVSFQQFCQTTAILS
jgi:hypothetical protein